MELVRWQGIKRPQKLVRLVFKIRVLPAKSEPGTNLNRDLFSRRPLSLRKSSTGTPEARDNRTACFSRVNVTLPNPVMYRIGTPQAEALASGLIT